MMVEAIENVMSQHYRITRDLDNSNKDEEESKGTPKDSKVAMAELKQGMSVGDNNYGGQQGLHQVQQYFNQF